MSSLADKIASLTNPTPKVQDPEDDVNIETVPHVNKFKDDDEAPYTVSELRSKTAPLLEDIDPAYAGVKVSRKSLDNIFQDVDNFSDETSNSENLSVEDENLIEDDDSDDSEDDDNDELIKDNLESFKQSVQNQHVSGDEKDDEDNESEASDDEIESSEDIVNKFSNIDVTSEIEKGAAVKAQQELFNRLCECRIKLQKLLIISNKLPQSNCWKALKKTGGKEVTNLINKGSNSVKMLLSNCLDLQEELLKQNSETCNLESNDSQQKSTTDNEEIPSDTDEEMDVHQEEEKIEKNVKRGLKRKLKCDEYGKILAKHHTSLLPYRNSVIQKWDEKTKLSSGRMTQKSFSAFESSAVKQIEQILQDEHRLIKRTQLKRSLYRVLGKPEVSEVMTDEKIQDDKPVSKQDLILRDYDPEIFDDDDFYRQLLKDVIESKSVGIDPAVLRKQLEIQNIRNKIKRRVDTKASKGRKIRYDVHPKLVNFMAPIETSAISDEARDNLLKSLFGKSFTKCS